MADNIDVPGLGPTKTTYVYAAVGGTVLVVGWFWYRSRSAGSSAPVDPGADTAGLDTAGSDGSAGALMSDTGPADAVYGGSGSQYGNDAGWVQGVTSLLSETGGWDPTLVVRALGKYLAGLALTAQEADVVTSAIGIGQAPPSGARPIILAPISGSTTVKGGGVTLPGGPSKPPATKPGVVKPKEPAKPAGRRYTVKAGDTLSRIAKRYRTTVAAILKKNKGIKDPDVIRAGQTITV